MERFRWGKLLACVVFAACGSDRSGGSSGVDQGADVASIGVEARVADLSDGQIQAICEDVEPYSDVNCGTEPETGEPYLVGSQTTTEGCEESLREWRASDENCQLGRAVADCWAASPCEKALSDVCALTCPEYSDCYRRGVDDCDDAWCYVEQGLRLHEDGSCFEARAAYCAPRNRNCASQGTTAIDPDGRCWLMSGICELPKGWQNEEGARTCPYLEALPGCP